MKKQDIKMQLIVGLLFLLALSLAGNNAPGAEIDARATTGPTMAIHDVKLFNLPTEPSLVKWEIHCGHQWKATSFYLFGTRHGRDPFDSPEIRSVEICSQCGIIRIPPDENK